jgi:hypothetical protein
LKKKLTILFSVLLTISLIILPLISCTPPDEAEPAESPFNQLQNRVTTVEAKVAGLEVAVNNIGVPADLTSQVSSLETQLVAIQTDVDDLSTTVVGVPSQEDITAIEVDVDELGLQIDTTNDGVGVNLTSIEALQAEHDTLVLELADIQTQIDELGGNGNPATEPEGYQDLLDDVAGLQATVAGIETTLAEIDNELDGIQSVLAGLVSDIEDMQATLNDIENTLVIINDLWVDLDYRVDDIEIDMLNVYQVVISKFISGSNYLEFTTVTAGDYAVVLTLYGSNLNLITIYVPPSQNITVVYDRWFGVNAMRVLVLEPKAVGTPPVSPNWAANTVVEVDFTGSGFSVDYAQVEAGAR